MSARVHDSDRPRKRRRLHPAPHRQQEDPQGKQCKADKRPSSPSNREVTIISNTDDDEDLKKTVELYLDANPSPNKLTPSTASGPDEVVCYGMIEGLPINAPSGPALHPNTLHEPVLLGPSRMVQRGADGQRLGTLEDFAAESLSKLAVDGEIELQLRCSTGIDPAKSPRGKCFISLDAIIYGPRQRADNVGDFVAACGYYLQDPLGCAKNVVYFNPHRLACLHGYSPMTFDLLQHNSLPVKDVTGMANDILAQFETTDVLDEEPTPPALSTPLKLHQKQALKFLKRRERGLSGLGNGLGIWARDESAGAAFIYINTITDQKQSQPPPIWRGGILADDMGLGKTLTIIALIASDIGTCIGSRPYERAQNSERVVTSTLIVVPPNVIPVWETQLRTHVHQGKLHWVKHHGQNRFDSANFDKQPDIVFTTYQTIEYEHRKLRCKERSVFSFCWKRIVLDEAHLVRNWNSSTAKAITSLNATCRWAISGTPVQNSLKDFFGVFKCLRFQPYDDEHMFDKDLLDLWRNRPAEEAAERFRKLLSCIMIRRQKSSGTVELPIRRDEIVGVTFDADEEIHYRTLERKMISFDEMNGRGSAPGNPWMYAMQQMNSLRIACNLGLSGLSAPTPQPQPCLQNNDVCDNCFSDLDTLRLESGLEYELQLRTSPTTWCYSECFRLFCFSCAELLDFEAPGPCGCGPPVERCRLQPMSSMTPSLSPRSSPGPDSASAQPAQRETVRIPSKVRALLSEIMAAPTEKHVVFSYWTSSLDIVEQALGAPGINIPCVRIDGNVKPALREDRLHRFRTEPKTGVILITISCGAVGLDLTVASRVHILEPQWNPSIEQQAMDRIHRIGQKRAVTTFRYIMKESIEEHILAVQDRKKLLATLLLARN